MPCYNRDRFITDAIESILQQSFSDFEFIIVNDGSTDATHSEIVKFKDDRIKYIQIPQNSGNYKARNIGMRNAIGKYVCVMDSDDIAVQDRLKIQYIYMEKASHIFVLGGQGQIIDESGYLTGDSISSPVCSWQEMKVFLLANNYILHPSMFFRRLILKRNNLLYNEKYKSSSDYDFVSRCSRLFPVKNIDETLIKYRCHREQISIANRAQQVMFADWIRLKKLHEIIVEPKEEEKKLYLKLMRKEALNRTELKGAELFLNKFLENNNTRKIYNQRLLYNYFDFIISEANAYLQAWSIECQLIHLINKCIDNNSLIVEFGSGSGTDELLKNYRVISIEHNPDYAIVRGRNHVCFLAPLVNNWYDRSIVAKVFNNYLPNIILVDGPPGINRINLLKNIDLLRGITCDIVFDDVDRSDDFSLCREVCQVLNYEFKIIVGKSKKIAWCKKK